MSDLPDHKHSQRELGDLRSRNAFESRPPIHHIMAQKLPTPVAIFAYIIDLTGAGLAYKEYYIPGFCCAGFCLLVAIFTAIKKERSRHHAAFLSIISLLVLVLGGVYYKQRLDEGNLPMQPLVPGMPY